MRRIAQPCRLRDIDCGTWGCATQGFGYPPTERVVLVRMRPFDRIGLPGRDHRLGQVVVEVVGVMDAGRQAMPTLIHCSSRECTIRRSNPKKESVSPCLGRLTSNVQRGDGLRSCVASPTLRHSNKEAYIECPNCNYRYRYNTRAVGIHFENHDTGFCVVVKCFPSPIHSVPIKLLQEIRVTVQYHDRLDTCETCDSSDERQKQEYQFKHIEDFSEYRYLRWFRTSTSLSLVVLAGASAIALRN